MSLHAGKAGGTAANGSIVYAQIQNEAASSLLGNPTGSPAAPSEITLVGGLSFSGTTLSGPVNHPGYIAGNWYAPVSASLAAAAVAPSAGSIRLLPFTISKPIRVQALGVRVTTASASGNFQLAIYANNATTGRPTGTALCSTASLSTTSVGAVSGAVTQVTLAPGTYWMAVNQDNAAAGYQTLAATASFYGMAIGSATLANITSGAASNNIALAVTQTFGTWPDLTAGSFTETMTTANAVVFLQAV